MTGEATPWWRAGDLAARTRTRLRRLAAGPPEPSQWTRLETEGIVSAGEGSYDLHSVHVHEFRGPSGEWLGHHLRVGRYCSIAPCDIFLGGNHHDDWVSQYPLRTQYRLPGAELDSFGRGDVVLGSDVWVGNGASILSGVSIGHGAVIATRAVVTRDVEPYAVVAGNPARVIRSRFDPGQVSKLLALAWWDWPRQEIIARVDELSAPPAGPEPA